MTRLRHKDSVSEIAGELGLAEWLVDAALQDWYEQVAQALVTTGSCALGDLGELAIYELDGVLRTRWLRGNGKRWQKAPTRPSKRFNNRRI
jgi:hypothetical protein